MSNGFAWGSPIELSSALGLFFSKLCKTEAAVFQGTKDDIQSFKVTLSSPTIQDECLSLTLEQIVHQDPEADVVRALMGPLRFLTPDQGLVIQCRTKGHRVKVRWGNKVE